jgi:anaerobic selenocysteine-containing dehydrogenase
VRSATGSIEVPVEVTDEIMPGVVSIPHGWGHDAGGVRMSVASAHAGVNSNVLADESRVEPLSGNAVLNGIPVEVGRSGENGAGLDGLEHRPAAVAADDVGGV